ncbi:hypothetical protein N320_08825, partial [Buceros rhinoceros silvestris]
FLLLAQGHERNDFEGMCCLNLSDHFNSIHKQLAQLHDNMHHIKISTSPFDSWLRS